MYLTAKELIPFLTGVVRYEETEKGLRLRRFTEKQEKAFFRPSPLFPDPEFDGYFGRNCLGGAGITADLRTDAGRVTFFFGGNELINDGSRGLCDLLVDGRYVRSALAGENISVSFRSPGVRRVTLYFPYFNDLTLSGLDLKSASLCTPVYRDGCELLLLGDSLTQGVGAVHPSRTMASVLGRRLGLSVLNQGNSGYVYDDATLDVLPTPKCILMAYGCNDKDRKTPGAIRRDTEAYVRAVRKRFPGVPAAGLLPMWLPGEEKGLPEVFREAYLAGGAEVIPGSGLIDHDESFFCRDGHPNDRGYQMAGRRLAPMIKSLLPAASYRASDTW